MSTITLETVRYISWIVGSNERNRIEKVTYKMQRTYPNMDRSCCCTVQSCEPLLPVYSLSSIIFPFSNRCLDRRPEDFCQQRHSRKCRDNESRFLSQTSYFIAWSATRRQPIMPFKLKIQATAERVNVVPILDKATWCHDDITARCYSITGLSQNPILPCGYNQQHSSLLKHSPFRIFPASPLEEWIFRLREVEKARCRSKL